MSQASRDYTDFINAEQEQHWEEINIERVIEQLNQIGLVVVPADMLKRVL